MNVLGGCDAAHSFFAIRLRRLGEFQMAYVGTGVPDGPQYISRDGKPILPCQRCIKCRYVTGVPSGTKILRNEVTKNLNRYCTI